jgi:hypothetical protein
LERIMETDRFPEPEAIMRRTVLVLATLIGVLAGMAQPAMALTVRPDPGMDMVAGNVYALDASGSWLYIGGKITAVRNGSKANMCAAHELVRFKEATGTADCSFTPNMPGTQVDGLAVMGGYVYAGGDFGLLRVSTTTGQIDPNFNPGVGNVVHTVLPARNGSGVYVGGAFQRVHGVKRAGFAFIKTDGGLGPQNPAADGVIRRLRWSPDGYIVASGGFEHINGHLDQSIAEINPDGSLRTGFAASIPEIGAMTCFDTAPTASVIYAACGQEHNFMAAFRSGTGGVIWRHHLGGNGESIVLATADGRRSIIVGGHFGTRDPNSMPCGSSYLHGVLRADPATGTINCSWNPTLFPDVHNLTGGWVECVTNGHLWLGGKFGKVDDTTHHSIVRWTL